MRVEEKMKKVLSEFMKNEYVVVFDTNIYLHLYEYSPHVTDAFISIIENASVKNNLYMPSTVKREFDKNYRICSGRQKKKFRDISLRLKSQTEEIQRKISKQLNELERIGFPNIKDLEKSCCTKIEEINQAFDAYEKEHNVYQNVCSKYFSEDKVVKLVKYIEEEKKILDPFIIDELYDICAEGKKRYKELIPPGFGDDKSKDGIEKYNDLLVWKEAIRLSKVKKCNMIFVTDDVKKDWRSKDSEGKSVFHEALELEFLKESGQQVLGLSAYEFFTTLSQIFEIPILDALESILEISAEEYIDNLVKSDEFINQIGDELMATSEEDYIDIGSLSNYDGSFFELQEVYDIELVDYYYKGYNDGKAEYEVIITVAATGRSKEYWCKDDETKDIILGEGCTNTLEGELTITILRKPDEHLIELIGSCDYEKIVIVSGELSEISAEYDYENDSEEDIEDDDVEELICPKCREVAAEGLMHDGYCSDCSQHVDEGIAEVTFPFESCMRK